MSVSLRLSRGGSKKRPYYKMACRAWAAGASSNLADLLKKK
jgi:ribosomal protein S16